MTALSEGCVRGCAWPMLIWHLSPLWSVFDFLITTTMLSVHMVMSFVVKVLVQVKPSWLGTVNSLTLSRQKKPSMMAHGCFEHQAIVRWSVIPVKL